MAAAIVVCSLHAETLYWKATYWLRPSLRVSAMWHIAEAPSTWNMPEIQDGLHPGRNEMLQERAAVAAGRLGLRDGVETLVRLSREDCLKVNPADSLNELFGGTIRLADFRWSVATWWDDVRDRIRFVPGTGSWIVAATPAAAAAR